MAFTSDLRIKNTIKEVHLAVLAELSKRHINENLYLRIFDESKEDSLNWEEGGLTFKNKLLNLNLGSNDAAWYYIAEGKAIPLVVIEGTFGTERGQFGDGQFNRFSHALGPAKNGFIGVLLIPFKGESYVKVETHETLFDYKFQYAHLRRDIVKAAIKVNKSEPGKYFTIDAYDLGLLKDLVLNSFLKAIKTENQYALICEKIEQKMKEYITGKERGKSNQLLDKVYDSKGDLLKGYTGRLFTHNYAALTTAEKRDAHGLLGKTLIESYLISPKKLLCIFIRLNKKEIGYLSSRTAKEFTYLLNNPELKIVCSEDLIIKDKPAELKLVMMRNQNLLLNSEKGFIKRIKGLFEKGEILVKL